MKEIADIVAAYHDLNKTGQEYALATVVRVSGSTYRRPGARMLFTERGRRAGLINAACLESDLLERARKTIRSGQPVLISYDTTSTDDIVFGLGLGCNGTVEIFMEPGQSPSTSKKIEVLGQCLDRTASTTLATVVAVRDTHDVRVGDFASFGPHGNGGTIRDVSLLSQIESESNRRTETLSARKPLPFHAGTIDLFFETIEPPLPLVIFGAGADAIPLVEAAKLLGWQVTVVDHRPAYATKDNVPHADAVVLAEPEDFQRNVGLTDRHIAVIMTHNFEKDRKLLRTLLQSPARYVGLLGPKTKFDNILQALEQEGFKPGVEERKKLHAPIGLDLGAETPEEIALSIISEIKAVLSGRSGGFLKDRIGPIH